MDYSFCAVMVVFILIASMIIFTQYKSLGTNQRLIRALEAVGVAVGIIMATFAPSFWKSVGEGLSAILLVDLTIFFMRLTARLRRFHKYFKHHKAEIENANRQIAQQKIPMQAFDVMYLHNHHQFYLKDSEVRWLRTYINQYSKSKQRIIFAVANITFHSMNHLGVVNSKEDKFDFKKFQDKLENFSKTHELGEN